jgi:hypothetical protein
MSKSASDKRKASAVGRAAREIDNLRTENAVLRATVDGAIMENDAPKSEKASMAEAYQARLVQLAECRTTIAAIENKIADMTYYLTLARLTIIRNEPNNIAAEMDDIERLAKEIREIAKGEG